MPVLSLRLGRRIRGLAAVSALALFTAAFAFSAVGPAAADTTPFNVRSQTHEAIAAYSVPDACSSTFVFVDATNYRIENLGSSTGLTSLTTLAVAVNGFNSCTGTAINAFFYGPASISLVVDGDLSSASLRGAVPLFDSLSGQSLTALLNLSWNATGSAFFFNSSGGEHFGSCTVADTTNQIRRFASVSGTLTVNGTNFAPSATQEAVIAFQEGGEVNVHC